MSTLNRALVTSTYDLPRVTVIDANSDGDLPPVFIEELSAKLTELSQRYSGSNALPIGGLIPLLEQVALRQGSADPPPPAWIPNSLRAGGVSYQPILRAYDRLVTMGTPNKNLANTVTVMMENFVKEFEGVRRGEGAEDLSLVEGMLSRWISSVGSVKGSEEYVARLREVERVLKSRR